MKLRIANLEMHLVHSCNLACESCSHYANQGHKGILLLEEADRWMRLWNGRIEPKTFSLLGGEPTIHPQLEELVLLTRRNWPEARLRLVTNGFFLHRHSQLPQILAEDRDAQLCLSVHHASPEYRARVQPILDLVRGWERDPGVRVVYYRSFANWTRRYRGHGAAMEPYADGKKLLEFLAREEESYCGMCPANPEKFELPLPIPVRKAEPVPVG